MQNDAEVVVATTDHAEPATEAATPAPNQATAPTAKVSPATSPTDPSETSADEGDEPQGKADNKADSTTPGPDEAAAREKRSRRDRRIDRLTARTSAAEREAAYWRGVAEARAEAARSSAVAQANPDPKPVLQDFDDPEEFAEAFGAWKGRQIEAADRTPKEPAKAPDDATPRQGADSGAQPRPSQASIDAAMRQFDDFEDVVFDQTLPLTQHMIEAIEDLPNFGELLYRFALNEDEVRRISKLNPKAQARELWRFADQLTAGQGNSEPGKDTGRESPGPNGQPQTRNQPEPGQPPNVTRAGPVPMHLQGSGRVGASDPFADNVSDEASIELLNRQAIARGRKPWEA